MKTGVQRARLPGALRGDHAEKKKKLARNDISKNHGADTNVPR